MALGGGTWVDQNKILPGSYINFVGLQRAIVTLGMRGVVALPILLDWGQVGDVFTVTLEQLSRYKNVSLKLFGYDYTDPQLINIREVFRNATTVHFYRLNNSPVKATNTFANAKYGGIRGNDLNIVIAVNIDDSNKFDVTTYLGTLKVDTQTVSSTATTDALVSNDWVDWKTNVELEATAGTPLAGGTNGSAVIGDDYQTFLDKIEPYSFNILACPVVDTDISSLFAEFTRRMREDVGVKFQTVVYKNTTADYEGVVSVENSVLNDGAAEQSLVYFTAGLLASAPVNGSVTNTLYSGEYDVDVAYTQVELEDALLAGKFIYHRVGSDVRTLVDINTLITIPDDKNEDFKSNQTIRGIDEIGMAIAAIFNNDFLGKVPNDHAGRISLWSRITEHHKLLQEQRAIENFDPDNVTVDIGNGKKKVLVNDIITVTGTMEQLYMQVLVQ
jgi:hypothetical protein